MSLFRLPARMIAATFFRAALRTGFGVVHALLMFGAGVGILLLLEAFNGR